MSEELEQAWSSLEAGRPEEALAFLSVLDEGDGDRWLVETAAWTDLGEDARAEAALRSAESLLGAGDPDLILAKAELRLAQWKVDEATELFERLCGESEDAGLLERLALCADLHGDHGRADELLTRAHRLEPDRGGLPPRLSADEFESVVARAAEALPDVFRRHLEEIPVIIDPMPSLALLGGGELGPPLPPDTLGVFSGRALDDRSVMDSMELPATIHLFQRNLERMCRSREELAEEIRVTLYHELGHALGFDEHGVSDMGLA